MVCYLRMCHKKLKLSCFLFTKLSYQRLISGISHTYLTHNIKDILSISQPYIAHILGINKACLRNISNISQTYSRYLLGISRASFFLKQFESYLRHILDITQIFKCLLTNDKLSVNSISYLYNYSLYTLRSSQLLQVPAC